MSEKDSATLDLMGIAGGDHNFREECRGGVAGKLVRSFVERMKQLGIFGLAIPGPWGDARSRRSATRGDRRAGPRLDVPGRRDGRAHHVVAKLLLAFGDREQQDR